MKSYRKELWFNITPDVEVALRESGIKEGVVLVNHNHITGPTNLPTE